MPIVSFQRLAIRDEPRVERRAQFRDEVGQRIGEILVLAAPKAVAAHHDRGCGNARRRDRSVASAAHSPRRQQALRAPRSPARRGRRSTCAQSMASTRAAMSEERIEYFCGCFHGEESRKSGQLAPPDFREIYPSSRANARQPRRRGDIDGQGPSASLQRQIDDGRRSPGPRMLSPRTGIGDHVIRRG